MIDKTTLCTPRISTTRNNTIGIKLEVAFNDDGID